MEKGQNIKKYSILTYIFGDYEYVKEIVVKDPEAEYILVTDNKKLASNTWTIIFDEKLDYLSLFDKCYYVRFHPFEYVNTDICVRIDGSILIKQSLSKIIEIFNAQNADICLMSNPMFRCLHEDYDYWVKNRNYSKECSVKCLAKLAELGYDKNYKGYYQLCFTITRKNNTTNAINEQAFRLLKELGDGNTIERFDQPVFSFIINRYFENNVTVMMVNEYLITYSKYMQWCQHRSNRHIPFKIKMELPYLFNRQVKCEALDYLSERGCTVRKIWYYIYKMFYIVKNKIRLRKWLHIRVNAQC